MPDVGRSNQLRIPDEGPIKPEEEPSTVRINVRKFQFLKGNKPKDDLKLSVSLVVDRVVMGEDEHFLMGEIQEVIPQAKEEKPPEERSGLIPK